MARTSGPENPDDSRTFYRRADAPRRGPARDDEDSGPMDARLLDVDEDEQESPFLRAQKRVPVRRSAIPRKTRSRLKIALTVAAIIAFVAVVGYFAKEYGAHNGRFRIESSDSIIVEGTQHISRQQVMQVMGADIGRNVFFVPLDERRKQLGEIPWVESATVMRFLPNALKIVIRERTPIAFVNVGGRVALIDSHGVIMDLPPSDLGKYSFPVILGMGENEPLSTRLVRMNTYTSLMKELDADGAQYSKDLNEIDLSDPEDVQITVGDTNGAVLIHLGHERFLERYKLYIAKVQEIRQQVQRLDSVDLRYDRQIIVNPDLRGTSLTPGAAEKPAPAPTIKPANKAAAKPAVVRKHHR
ncbi:MAG TPA: FtsQ-type POTRA domain-containing protein [candidate division Zixibacteria bacterium]|nr:FtsQ-type POTRA domain-containing protein [candidate division Zixibacteria bacterium]